MKKKKVERWTVQMIEVRTYACSYTVLASSREEAEARALVGLTSAEVCRCHGTTGRTLEPLTHAHRTANGS